MLTYLTAKIGTRRISSFGIDFFKDFGDGGAFPEIHVAQYPLSMGFKKASSNALAVQVDATGKIKYDAIAKVGHSKDKVSNTSNLF